MCIRDSFLLSLDRASLRSKVYNFQCPQKWTEPDREHGMTTMGLGERQPIDQMLATQLALQETVKEDYLLLWYLEQIQEEVQTRKQLFEEQKRVQLTIEKMMQDGITIVHRLSEDPSSETAELTSSDDEHGDGRRAKKGGRRR